MSFKLTDKRFASAQISYPLAANSRPPLVLNYFMPVKHAAVCAAFGAA